MSDLNSKLAELERLATTYCIGKVEGEINTPKQGMGDYYAYAKGTTFLSTTLDDAVSLAISQLTVRQA